MSGCLEVEINAVLIGPIGELGPLGARSGIAKVRQTGPIAIGREGIAGDEQADRRHHGGPEKVVHHYAIDHYPAWRRELSVAGPSPLDGPGAFGENLSTSGLTEAEVCVGDLWRVGAALLQVSQARQPCWKLNLRFGVADMARRVQTSGRTGWYYRVVEPGLAAAGEAMRLVARPNPEWPLSRLLRAFYLDRLDRDALAGIAGLETLSLSWRELARRRLDRGVVEDWRPRIDGSSPR